MTARLGEINARMETMRQLSSVLAAIRGIAAARSREARGRVAAVQAHAQIVGTAIGEALALLPEKPQAGRRGAALRRMVLAFCAEQGFAGAYSRRVLDTARAHAGDAEYFVIGARGLGVAAECGVTVGWSGAMISQVGQVSALAETLVELLHAQLAERSAEQVLLVHARPEPGGIAIVTKQLLPFDFSRFPPASGAPPLVTLPPQVLARELAQEHVFAELCEAILLSCAAENEARALALLAASTNVDRKLDDLVGEARRLRQDEITNEVVELAAGAAAMMATSRILQKQDHL